MRVGPLAKGLLLHNDLTLHFVVLCSEKPTRTLLDTVADRLTKQLEVFHCTTPFWISKKCISRIPALIYLSIYGTRPCLKLHFIFVEINYLRSITGCTFQITWRFAYLKRRVGDVWVTEELCWNGDWGWIAKRLCKTLLKFSKIKMAVDMDHLRYSRLHRIFYWWT